MEDLENQLDIMIEQCEGGYIPIEYIEEMDKMKEQLEQGLSGSYQDAMDVLETERILNKIEDSLNRFRDKSTSAEELTLENDGTEENNFEESEDLIIDTVVEDENVINNLEENSEESVIDDLNENLEDDIINDLEGNSDDVVIDELDENNQEIEEIVTVNNNIKDENTISLHNPTDDYLKIAEEICNSRKGNQNGLQQNINTIEKAKSIIINEIRSVSDEPNSEPQATNEVSDKEVNYLDERV